MGMRIPHPNLKPHPQGYYELVAKTYRSTFKSLPAGDVNGVDIPVDSLRVDIPDVTADSEAVVSCTVDDSVNGDDVEYSDVCSLGTSDMVVYDVDIAAVVETLLQQRVHTVYPKKYAHGFVVLCFVVVMQSFIMNSHEVFIHIHQGCFAGTGAIVRLPQCQ